MAVTTTVRVRYAETDQMGVVYYANYLVWFEVGRVEYLRGLGYDYRQMEETDGAILPVVEANCRYRAPARYDDLIEIEASPILLRGAVLKFGYRIYRAATEAAEPPEEPPGVSGWFEPRRRQGLTTGPHIEVSLDEPMANSSMFSLPSIRAPSRHSWLVTVDS